MAQRNSEYPRAPNDTYITPQPIWDQLYEVEPWTRDAFECAPVDSDFDFLTMTALPAGYTSVASNPPFRLAAEFIRHALELTKPHAGKVAMLAPYAFDSAKRRINLFDRPPFAKRWSITTRIKWENFKHVASHGTNHVWLIWNWEHKGPPEMGWL
jgi:hypothetical protein